MKKTPIPTTAAFSALSLVAGLLTAPASAQSLDFVARTQISQNNQRADISVFPGKAGYASSDQVIPATSGTFGDGTVTDYRFISSDGDNLNTYASGAANLIAQPTAPGGDNVSGTQNWSDLWETTDPGDPLFSTSPDVSPAGWSGGADVTGTIDISSLSGAGSIYIMHGTYVNTWTVRVTMIDSDAVLPDIVAEDTQPNGPGTNLGWISEFAFAGAAGYDTIQYYYYNGDRDGSRARFMGVILDEDSSAPVIVSTTPPNGSTTVFNGANLEFTFDEDFTVNTGNITITNLDAGTDTVIDINDATQVTVVDRTFIVDPATDLAFSTNYAVKIDAGIVGDFAAPPNTFAGISDNTTWAFTTLAPDSTPPVLASTVPANGTTALPGDALVATFDEAIVAGTGNITLRNLTDAVDTVIDVTDTTQVTTSGNDLVISPASPLTGGVNYAVQIDATAIDNLAGFDFAGITDDTTWTFGTYSETTLTASGNWVGGEWTTPPGEPGPGLDAIIAPDVACTANNSVNPWSGVLTMGAGSSMRIDSGTNPNPDNMVFDGATQFVLNDGVVINDNFKTATFEQDWVINGTAGLDSTNNAGNNHNRIFTGTISGGTWVTDGRNHQGYTYNTANTFTAYEVRSSESQRHGVFFGAPGAAGAGNVTVTTGSGTQSAVLILGADDVFAPSCVLTLNGRGWDSSTGGFGPYAGGPHVGTPARIRMDTFNATVSELYVDDIQVPAGDYTGGDFDWIIGSGVLTVTSGVNEPPTLVSIEDNVSGGPVLENQAFTYFVTFNEAIDPVSIDADDFENAGAPAPTITLVTPTSDPAVFAVNVTPGGVGTIQLQIKAGTEILDVFGAPLDTSAALPDDTTITVEAGTLPPRQVVTVDGSVTAENTTSTITITFDASASDKLVVVATTENGNNTTSGTVSAITYDGEPLTQAVFRAPVAGNITYNSIWYLDNPGDFHSAGEIVTTTNNRNAITAIALSGTAPGVGATAVSPDDSKSVGIATTTENSLVVASHGMGGNGNSANVNNVDTVAPLVEIGAIEFGNNWGGHVSGAAPAPNAGFGLHEFTGGSIAGVHTIAAEFQGALPEINDYDDWAALYPDADLTDPAADFDGDGVINDDERLFGLDPTDPASQNPITIPLDAAAGTLSFTRRDDALTGKFSGVETSTDLVTWTEDTGATLVAGDPDANSVETVQVTLSTGLLSAPKLFVRIVQDDGIILSENFESDNGLFTFDTAAGSDWAHGDPDSSSLGGSILTGNGGSTNCWGTDIGNPGEYTVPTTTVLSSPPIDLSAVTGAKLTFAEALDLASGDVAEVYLVDNSTGDPIGGAIYTAVDADDSVAPWKTVPAIDLAAGIGTTVRIEWRFTGGTLQYMGWYIDDVTVSKSAP